LQDDLMIKAEGLDSLTDDELRMPATHLFIETLRTLPAVCLRLQDDLMIKAEGLDSLTDDELRTACKARGLKAAYGEGAASYMRKQMQVPGGGCQDSLSLGHGSCVQSALLC
jgi:hypothetical protein